MKFVDGLMIHSGDPCNDYVDTACRHVLLRQGVAILQAIPIPRKTLTALEPVTLPTEASAVSSSIAAVLEAEVSGTLVPRATKPMALTQSLRLMKHPRCPAMSPITAVFAPMKRMEITNVGYPS